MAHVFRTEPPSFRPLYIASAIKLAALNANAPASLQTFARTRRLYSLGAVCPRAVRVGVAGLASIRLRDSLERDCLLVAYVASCSWRRKTRPEECPANGTETGSKKPSERGCRKWSRPSVRRLRCRSVVCVLDSDSYGHSDGGPNSKAMNAAHAKRDLIPLLESGRIPTQL